METFKARARTVDMLGRQQIAGIPTAISELFKNAHDAYADEVRVDVLRDQELLWLRDDGIGMSKKAFLERWLVIGTESKVGAARELPPPGNKKRRPLQGEKGIGRLAIASIGPLLLVMTRADTPSGGGGPLTMALIHWGLFELPGVNLEQIKIPVRATRAGKLPDAKRVQKLRQELLGTVTELKVPASRKKELRDEIRQFSVDPRQLDEDIPGPSLADGGAGTHFFVSPTSSELFAEMDEADAGTAPKLRSTLIGFSNTMLPGSPPPRIRTNFVDHRGKKPTEVIAPGNFFTPGEFQSADHHIEGAFDEFGRFEGTVTVYGKTIDHDVPWPKARGRVVDCGPFSMRMAVVQGKESQSRMPPAEWVSLNLKLKRFGGLYIYRDGIRVLPYGRSDHDFLDFERERSKNISRGYFSHRRMFGAIDLDAANEALREKAGREGFIENSAYRKFREVLKHFFRETAREIFTEGEKADTFLEIRADLEQKFQARRERELRSAERRKEFATELDRILAAIDEGTPAIEVGAVLEDAVGDLGGAQDEEALLVVERTAVARIAAISGATSVRPPRGFALDTELRREWSAYLREHERLTKEVFDPSRRRLAEDVQRRSEELSLELQGAERARGLLMQVSERVRAEVEEDAEFTETALQTLTEGVTESIEACRRDLDQAVTEALAGTAAIHNGDGEAKRPELEEHLVRAAEFQQSALENISLQLRAVRWTRDENGIPGSELLAGDAMEEELLELRERAEADLELAQLGMAIQVVTHEFNSTVGSLRSGLRELRGWARANDGLEPLYEDLKTSFDHLDGYLALLTPLQRRLNRRRSKIRGQEIVRFVEQLFTDRLQRQEVELRATPEFSRFEVTGFRSSFYPAFINLVDNALFWVSEGPEPEFVSLDADGEAMLVSDSGPGIRLRDKESVFEFGFSRKPGGTGAGLYIAREILSREGYTLTVEDDSDGGTRFRIAPEPEESE